MEKVDQNSPKFVIIDSSNERGKASEVMPEMTTLETTKEELTEKGIIHPSMNDSNVLNAFRHLRTTLLPKMESYNSTLLVSSIVKGGGASFTAANLAAAFTLDRQRTALLVDCNFHSPTLATTLGVDGEFGLYDYVTGRIDNVAQMIYPTIVPRLRLVPCGELGEDDNQEFFTGERMRSFLHEVKSRYPDRIIILDSPPVLDTADTTILSELVDYVFLVLPYQGAGASKLNKAIKTIGKEKIVGFVLNN